MEKGRQRLEIERESKSDSTSALETVDTFDPEVLISLTAPKEGVRAYKGRHWLGGRFVPE